MRGKRTLSEINVLDVRITPAGAGKTYNAVPVILPLTDHPRRCGENIPPLSVHVTDLGSPPQVRGKHHNNIIV